MVTMDFVTICLPVNDGLGCVSPFHQHSAAAILRRQEQADRGQRLRWVLRASALQCDDLSWVEEHASLCRAHKTRWQFETAAVDENYCLQSPLIKRRIQTCQCIQSHFSESHSNSLQLFHYVLSPTTLSAMSENNVHKSTSFDDTVRMSKKNVHKSTICPRLGALHSER